MSGTTGVAWRQGFNPPYTEAANDNHIFISLNGPTPTAVIDFSGLSPTLTPVSLLLYDADSPTTDARTDIGSSLILETMGPLMSPQRVWRHQHRPLLAQMERSITILHMRTDRRTRLQFLLVQSR